MMKRLMIAALIAMLPTVALADDQAHKAAIQQRVKGAMEMAMVEIDKNVPPLMQSTAVQLIYMDTWGRINTMEDECKQGASAEHCKKVSDWAREGLTDWWQTVRQSVRK